MPVPSVIGVDVGGSKTHGVRWTGGRVVAEAFGRSANIASVGVQEATVQLHALLDALGPDALDHDELDGHELDGHEPDGHEPGRDEVHAVCVGTAGGDLAEQQLKDVVRARFPAVPVQVVHDTHLILAAAGLAHGVVVISGTGSAAWGRSVDGAEARAGGWGYLLGDDGSAYGVVRAALRVILGRSDAGAPPDRLTEEFLRGTATATPRELLDLFYREPARRRWAPESAIVFRLAERGDATAAAIVAGAAEELVRSAVSVARSVASAGPVVLAGGLAVHQPLLQVAVRAGLAAAGLPDLHVLHRDPVHGAVALARRALDEVPVPSPAGSPPGAATGRPTAR